MIKPTKDTLILSIGLSVVLALWCLPFPCQRIVTVKWRVIKKTYVVNRLLSLTIMILCLGKLGKMNIVEFSWILVNCGFYGNQRNSGLAPYLKMLVLVTTISVPNFMLVSKSAQFTWNFELCRRTTGREKLNTWDRGKVCQADPRWRPNREIAWYTERLLLCHVRYAKRLKQYAFSFIETQLTYTQKTSNPQLFALKLKRSFLALNEEGKKKERKANRIITLDSGNYRKL